MPPPVDERVNGEPLPSGDLARAVRALELALMRQRRGVRQRLDVNEDELAILLHLAHADGALQAQLTNLTTLSRSGTGALVARLEAAGLLERRAVPGDRRLRLVRLSDSGRERVEAACREREDAIRRFAASPVAALVAAEQLLDGLAAAVDAGGDDPSIAEWRGAAFGRAEPIWRRWG